MQKLINEMKALGLSPKKEIRTLLLYDLILLIAGVGLFFFLRQPLVFAYLFMAIVLFDGLYLSRYGKALALSMEKKEEDFVTLFSYFSIYIRNGFNVYSSLKESLPYCPKSLKAGLSLLIDDMDQDKSVAPFLTFASLFQSLTIKEVLLSVYQMIDEGGGEAHIMRFTYLFSSLSQEKRKIQKEREDASMASLTSLPLVGSGIAMLMLTAALTQIMGGLFDVI